MYPGRDAVVGAAGVGGKRQDGQQQDAEALHFKNRSRASGARTSDPEMSSVMMTSTDVL
jgi:hypothetical protein